VSVINYNQQMRGVDKKDQLLQMYLVQGRKIRIGELSCW
jgi:hypothetical protein